MKRILMTVVLAIVMLAAGVNASAEVQKIVLVGDSLAVVDGSDTTMVEDIKTFTNETKNVVDLLNDTMTKNIEYVEKNSFESFVAWQNVIKLAIVICTIGTFVIIALGLLFVYMMRRRKYKMIEKAIENNYELPVGVAGYYPGKEPQQTKEIHYVPNPYFPNAPQAMPNTDSEPAPTQPLSCPQLGAMVKGYDVRRFKKAITLVLVGFIGTCFFWHDAPLNVLSMAIFAVGVYKGVIEYLEQKNLMRYNAWMQANGKKAEDVKETEGEGQQTPPAL